MDLGTTDQERIEDAVAAKLLARPEKVQTVR